MTKALQVAYVLVYHGHGRYPIMTAVSTSAARRVQPDANYVLLCDEETPAHVRQDLPHLLELFDHVETVPCGSIDSLRARSFYLKTKVRDFVEGDLIYLDSDTLPVKSFSGMAAGDWEVGLIQDRNHHGPITPVFPHWVVPRVKRMNWVPNFPKYYNAGIYFLRDTTRVRAMVADWQRRWRQLWDNLRDDCDQICLNMALNTIPVDVRELPPLYNAMVTVHPLHARDAVIYHFFAANQQAWEHTLFEHLLRHFEAKGEMDWASVDRCVAMEHPWMPPYWPYRLWQTGNHWRAMASALSQAPKKLVRALWPYRKMNPSRAS